MTDHDLLPAELALDDEPFGDDELDLVLERFDDLTGEDPAELSPDAQRALVVQRWLPADRGSAEWALRKLARVEQEIADVVNQGAEWQRQIDVWVKAETARLEARSLRWQGALIGYAQTLIDADPKQGTVTLPSGRVKVTRYKARVGVDDRALVAKSAAANLEGDDLAAAVNTPPPPAPVAVAKEVTKLAKIVERTVARRFALELEGGLGCETIWPVPDAESEPAAPAVGETWQYDDGIDERELEIVSVTELEPETVPVAVWADTGQPIEGAVVVPARIDFTVET